LSKDTFDIGRNFANKLWNASRFLLENISDKPNFSALPLHSELSFEDQWILSRLNKTIRDVTESLAAFRTNETAHLMYDFVWHDFCDWYIEIKKADLYQTDDARRRLNALNLCSYVLGTLLKLLHPIMPFITEEIWGHVREAIDYPTLLDSPVMVESAFPVSSAGAIDEETEKDFTLLKDVVVALRTIRAENNVPPDKKGTAVLIPAGQREQGVLAAHCDVINMFARLSSTEVSMTASKPKLAGQSVVMGTQIYLVLEGLIDKAVERQRLEKEIARVKGLAAGVKARLESGSFADKAPAEVVFKEREKYDGIVVTLEKLEKNLVMLSD
jgi:valyl-tRNA synthetase